jgi:hypothetical protein
MSYRTFSLTFNCIGRPEELQEKLDNWLLKKTQYFFIAKEKKDTEREHLHAGFVMDKPWYISNMRETIKRLYKNDLTHEEKAHAIEIKPWWSDDWYNKYCQKEGDEAIYLQELPEDFQEISALYPLKDDSQLKKRTHSIWYFNMEEKFNAQDPPVLPTLENIRRFVRIQMFVDRTIEVIADTKIFNQKCAALERFITKDPEESEEMPMGICESCKKRKHAGEFCT